MAECSTVCTNMTRGFKRGTRVLYGGTLPAACGEHQVHEVRLYYMYGTVIIGNYTTQYRYCRSAGTELPTTVAGHDLYTRGPAKHTVLFPPSLRSTKGVTVCFLKPDQPRLVFWLASSIVSTG